ncbi:MAG: phosphatidate cytidylyltransferase [Maledivibacter sp.]|jgi:phosphatidate cytidylyltransferase|nr:phosphatidate cytidylyltransferase [Maledivibacter sp.]
MLKRILSGAIGVPLLIFIVMSGGMVLKLSTLVVVLIALKEFYHSFNQIEIYPLSYLGYIFTIFMYFTVSSFYVNFTFLLITFAVLLIFLFNKKVALTDISITLLGFLYISYFLLHIILTSTLDSNMLIWFIFIIAWSADTSAYFAGNFFGTKIFGPKKLFPEVSPKKTIEGFVGGILGSTLASFIFSYLFLPDFLVHSTILGFLGSFISQTGDLVASKIKRTVGIKDFGNVMPGHGGILDRFDSILLIAPIVYYYTLFFFK